MDKKITLVRDRKGRTKMMEVKASMWNNPETVQQKKAVLHLKRTGWEEIDPETTYIIDTQHATIELSPKKKRRKNKSTSAENEEVNGN